MARPRLAVDTTVRLDPRFAAAWSLVGIDRYEGRPEPTVRDACVALGLIGLFTREDYPWRPETDEDKLRLAEFERVMKGSYTARSPAAHVMRFGGYEAVAHAQASLDRLFRCDVGVQPLLLPAGGYEFEDGRLDVLLNGATCAAAHPVKFKRQPMVIDLRSLHALRCRHSVPILLRALAWHRHGVLGDMPGGEVHATPSGNVVANVVARDIPEALGLDMRQRFDPAEFTPVMRKIARDFERTGLGVRFQWQDTHFGRHQRLRIEVGSLRTKAAAETPPNRPTTNPFAGLLEDV